MRFRAVLMVAVALMAWGTSSTAQTHLGIVATYPWSVSLQVEFPEGIAIQAGVAATGPAVFAAKLYLQPVLVGGLSWVPSLGLGGAVAFLPGNLTAFGLYALAGVELPVPKTPFSVLADVVLVLPWPIGVGTLHVGPQIGVRLIF